jgi:DNA-binding response OmpR family regulator
MVKKRKTILIVDDEEAVRNLLQRTLQDVGYDVITAANGQEALDKVPQFNVSLVLLDIMMPGLDGFQVLDLIRQQSSVPVIMLTGRGEVTTLRDALVLGADDYVRKPFRTRELLARIEVKLRRTET